MTKKDLRDRFMKAIPTMVIKGNTSSYADWLEELIIKENLVNKNDSKSSVSKCATFKVKWHISAAFGYGSGETNIEAIDRDDAIEQFWNDRNKEKYEIDNVA
jgi:hypothetical protein